MATADDFYRDQWDMEVDTKLLTLTEGEHGIYSTDIITDEVLDDLYNDGRTPMEAARELLAKLQEPEEKKDAEG